MCLISFGIAALLRVIHNAIHSKRKAGLERHCQQANPFSYPDIQSAIQALADMERPHDMGAALTVPRRIMTMMEKKYQRGLSAKEMCELYISAYYSENAEEKCP